MLGATFPHRVAVNTRSPRGAPRVAWVRRGPAGTLVESAAFVGHATLPRPAPWRADSAPLADGLRAGVGPVWLAVGGTATTDAGAGLIAALGGVWLDRWGRPLAAPRAREAAWTLQAPSWPVTAWVDVDVPLRGAAAFVAQKGARSEARYLRGWDRLACAAARGGCSADPEAPGAGAGGGLGWAVLVLGGRIESGAEAVAAAVGLPERVAAADLVVVAEGRWDAGSRRGKVPEVVRRAATRVGVPVALVAGRIAGDTAGFLDVEPLGVSGPPRLADTEVDLAAAAERLARRVSARVPPPGGASTASNG